MRLPGILLLCVSSLASYCQDLKSQLDLRVTPGIDFARMTIENSPVMNNQNFRIGAEVELILPINDHKWGFVGEPAFQSFRQPSLSYSYESIETSLGLRRHFAIKENMSWYINVMSIIDVPLQHIQKYPVGRQGTLILRDNSVAGGFSLGAGFALRRISIEGRYYTRRTREADQLPMTYRYSKASVIFGFKIF